MLIAHFARKVIGGREQRKTGFMPGHRRAIFRQLGVSISVPSFQPANNRSSKRAKSVGPTPQMRAAAASAAICASG